MRYKFGNSPFDFLPWVKAFANPLKNGKKVQIPIVALIDNYTVSTAELVAMAIKSFPNGILIGERTYGATGPVILKELHNSGPFSVGEYLTVNMASAAFKPIDRKFYEGQGFEPDILVPFNAEALSSGVDLQLEKAISVILKK